MVLEALVWKTSPGACEVEPPVSGRGPWSTTVTRSQPRAVSSSARLAPTIPAPTTTTRGVVDIALAPDVPVDPGAADEGRSAVLRDGGLRAASRGPSASPWCPRRAGRAPVVRTGSARRIGAAGGTA